MVVEFEQLINRLRCAGQERVASDLEEVLERHRGFLPSQLPQEELILEDDYPRVVITRQMVENPDYLPFLLDKLIYRTPNPIELIPGKFSTLHTLTRNRLFRYAHPFGENQKKLSLSELMTMSDVELLGIKRLGLNGLRLFRAATLPVKEKLFGQTI